MMNWHGCLTILGLWQQILHLPKGRLVLFICEGVVLSAGLQSVLKSLHSMQRAWRIAKKERSPLWAAMHAAIFPGVDIADIKEIILDGANRLV